jgi:hypothetical protein
MNRGVCGIPQWAIGLCAAASLVPHVCWAGTTGKISGRVIDAAQKPVPWVQVLVPAQRLSANTNAEGEYTILNVPPGTYEVIFRHVSYKQLTVRDVLVTADQAARTDATLVEATVATLEEIVVTAKRPPVDLNLTSSQTTVTREEIEQLPVQQLDDLVNLQAGVVEGHFRGGRLGEVQYQVDGISVNNAFDNKNAFTLDRSLLQEVQVISGTFDAEYGQAMSGVVNAVLRQGTDKFQWSAEGYTGGFAYSEDQRSAQNSFDPVESGACKERRADRCRSRIPSSWAACAGLPRMITSSACGVLLPVTLPISRTRSSWEPATERKFPWPSTGNGQAPGSSPTPLSRIPNSITSSSSTSPKDGRKTLHSGSIQTASRGRRSSPFATGRIGRRRSTRTRISS